MKRITAALCTVCMLCALFPMTAYAVPKRKLEGVDYDRIQYSDKSYQTKLTIGNLEFWGELSRGTELTADEIDKIIRGIQLDMEITSGMLINAEVLIERMANVEGFGAGDIASVLLKLTGAEDFVGLYRIVMGAPGANSTDIAMDIAKNQLVDFAEDQMEDVLTHGGKLALKGGGKFAFKLLFLLPDLTEIGVSALLKYQDIKETVALGIEKKLMLDGFYQACNDKIEESSGDGGEWRLSFHEAVSTYNFNMWGIGGLMSEWTLTGELVRQVTGSGDNYGGTYQGILTLKIEGVDMASSFDARFMENDAFYNMDKTDWTMRGITPKDDYKTTILKRIVSGDFTVYILEGSGQITPTVLGSLTGGSDKTEFAFEHDINGTGTFAGGGAVVAMEQSLKYVSNDISSYSFELTSYAGDMHLETVTNTIPQDPGTVWKPLDSEPIIIIYIH